MAVEKRKDDITALYDAGVKPIRILLQIQLEEDPEVKALKRYDIYNTILRHRQQGMSTSTNDEVDEVEFEKEAIRRQGWGHVYTAAGIHVLPIAAPAGRAKLGMYYVWGMEYVALEWDNMGDERFGYSSIA
jgi:hypothetical protein